jgi:hypothetical protein
LDYPRKPRQQCEAEVAAQLQEWGFPEPERYDTIAPEMRVLTLANHLDTIISRLREAETDSARAGTAVWAASQLENVVSGLREVLRPGQLARLCAFLRDLPCESISVGTGGTAVASPNPPHTISYTTDTSLTECRGTHRTSQHAGTGHRERRPGKCSGSNWGSRAAPSPAMDSVARTYPK